MFTLSGPEGADGGLRPPVGLRRAITHPLGPTQRDNPSTRTYRTPSPKLPRAVLPSVLLRITCCDCLLPLSPSEGDGRGAWRSSFGEVHVCLSVHLRVDDQGAASGRPLCVSRWTTSPSQPEGKQTIDMKDVT